MGNNENFLSDWLENKMTDDELKKIVSDENFLAFQKIKNAVENLKIEDSNLSSNYEAIQSKIKKLKTEKSKVFVLWKYASIAASLLIFTATYFYFSKVNKFETGFGQKQEIALLDESAVILNAKSKLAYSNFFNFNRSLTLSGEAYFQVKKGSQFTVNTLQGKVEVLGTKFNVLSQNNGFFEINCFEGKVKVSVKQQSIILIKGESVRFYENKIEKWYEKNKTQPTWLTFESSFKNTPVKLVFEKIKNQYGVEIAIPEAIKNIKFTGTVTHKDFKTALQSVCIPLQLNFKFIDSKNVEINNE